MAILRRSAVWAGRLACAQIRYRLGRHFGGSLGARAAPDGGGREGGGATHRMRGQPTLAVAALILGAAPAIALGAGDDAEEAESPWRIGVAFGRGERSNPLIQSDDIDILVDIDIAWFGERWFFDNGDVGRTLRDGERYTLNVIGRFNSDRVFFSKTDTEYVSLFAGQAGGFAAEPIEVPDRDYAFEVGLEYLSDGDWGFLQAAVHKDVSDRHRGY